MTRALPLMVLVLAACSSTETGADEHTRSGVEPTVAESDDTSSPEVAEELAGGDEFSSDDAEQSAAGDESESPLCDWYLDDETLVGPDFEAERVQEVDIDGEPPTDLIGSLGMCGSWGDCMYVVVRACEDGSYESVWGPDYAQWIDVGKRPEGAEFSNLVVGGRTATAGCDLALITTLIWTEDGWKEDETCGAGGIWDEETCGESPYPSCP